MILEMEYLLFFIIILLIFVIIFSVVKRKGEDPLVLKEELTDLKNQMRETFKISNQSLQNQLKETGKIREEGNKVVKEVIEKLVRLDETNKQVINFASQLQSLEDILKNPKQRGILGEYYLEELLENVFSPRQYQMQYQFEDGQIVDAVIFVKDGKIIPIDSKFSLENYNRIVVEKDEDKRKQLEKLFSQDLKNRIDETAKYIKPNEGTLNFAIMFIPAEAIYYDLMVNKIGAVKANTRDLIEYAAREKHVIIVSPTSFHAYLQTVLQGLRAFQIEKSATEIRKRVEALGKHIFVYDSHMKRLGNQLGTACNTYNTAYRELGKIDKDVVKITEGKRKIEPTQLEKPNLD